MIERYAAHDELPRLDERAETELFSEVVIMHVDDVWFEGRPG
jgi:hypothetical protein